MSPLTVFLVLCTCIVGTMLILLVLEAHTLRDSHPDNHITASVRHVTRRHTGLVLLLWGLLNFTIGAVCGHIWHEW